MLRDFPVVTCLCVATLFSATTARADSFELRLISYNVYLVPYTAPARAERLERLPEKLGELRPDVVMLQEVWSEADSASLERSLRSLGLAHVYRDASSAPFSYDSTGMLIASRFPITDSHGHNFTLGRLPHTPYHLDWIGKKGALDVRVETPLGAVRFVNTHLQASYSTGSYEAVRVAQSLELADWLEDDSLPLVLGGDFNARPDWPSCRVLRERSGARLPEGRWRVDQVLLRDGASLAVESVEMQRLLHEPIALSDGSKRRLSDHRAVLMRLRLRTRAAILGAVATAPVSDPMLVEQAGDVLRANLIRTGRQKFASYAVLLTCLVGMLWGSRRLRRARADKSRTRRFGLLVSAFLLTGIWVAYFLVGYVPHRVAGLEQALVALTKTPS